MQCPRSFQRQFFKVTISEPLLLPRNPVTSKPDTGILFISARCIRFFTFTDKKWNLLPALNYDLRAREVVFLSGHFPPPPPPLPILLLLLLCPEGIADLNLGSMFSSYISLSSRDTSKSRLFLQRDYVNDILYMCTLYTDFRSLIDVIHVKYIIRHV